MQPHEVLVYKLPLDKQFYDLHDHADIRGVGLIFKLKPKYNVQAAIDVVALITSLNVAAGLSSTFTPEYGMGNYINIGMVDQDDWIKLVNAGVFAGAEPIVYAVPLFDFNKLVAESFKINLDTVGEVMVYRNPSSELFDTCVRNKELISINSDGVGLVSCLGLSNHPR